MFKTMRILVLVSTASALQAQFLAQGSFSFQVNDRLMRLSGYQVQYETKEASPYDLSFGYMFNFKDVAVMPIMLEGKTTTIESYLNSKALSSDKLAPLEVLVKPGLKLTDSDIYVILGYQLGNFKQNVKADGHDIELAVKPNFYGWGYTKMLSDYLDYLAELKVYYHSNHAYGFNFQKTEWDPNLKIKDAKFRLGFRIKV